MPKVNNQETLLHIQVFDLLIACKVFAKFLQSETTLQDQHVATKSAALQLVYLIYV